MEKITIISDIHGRDTWKKIIAKESPTQVVIMGDYWDSFDIPFETQFDNAKEIIEYKKNNPNTILLLGNHDISYIIEHPRNNVSGKQVNHQHFIRNIMVSNSELFQMAYSINEKFLLTHAGVSELWLNKNTSAYELFYDIKSAKSISDVINELYAYKPFVFLFSGINSYGDNTTQTPIWIRPKSLKNSSRRIKQNMIQIVGHTHNEKIEITKYTKYIFTDTLNNKNPDYISIMGGDIIINKLND